MGFSSGFKGLSHRSGHKLCYTAVTFCHFVFVQVSQEMYASEIIRIKNLIKVRGEVQPRTGHEGPDGE